MKIILVNQYFYPDEAATSQFLTDLAIFLAGRGHEVDVLCGRARYCSPSPSRAGELEGVRIRRLWGTDSHGRVGLAGKAADYATFLLSATFRIARMRRADVVVALSTPPMLGCLGIWAKRQGHGRFVFWVQDIYPEIAERLGVLRWRPLQRLFRAMMASVYRAADAVVALGKVMADQLESGYAVPGKVEVVHHWPLENSPGLRDQERRRLGWANDFVILYSGNLGRAHEATTFLEAFKTFAAGHSEARLVVAGEGYRRAEVAEFLRRHAELRIDLIGHQQREDVPAFLEAADVHLISQQPEVDGLVVPSKLYGILESGRPFCFVGSSRNEVARLIEKHRTGFRVEPGDAAGLAAAWEKLKRDPALQCELGEKARRLARNKFSKRAGLEKLASIVERGSLPGGE